MRVHIVGYSQEHLPNECIVTSYLVLPPVKYKQQTDLFSYHNPNDFLQTVTSQSKAEHKLHHLLLNTQHYTLLDVNISGST